MLDSAGISSTTVITLATVMNVVLTAVYAFFIWRLWQKTRRQAELTGQQTVQTHEIFEATHRPGVSIEPFQLYPFTDSQIRLDFRLHNHRPSPAFVTRWVRYWDLDSSERPPLTVDTPADSVSWCVLPNGDCQAVELKVGDPRAHGARAAASRSPHSTTAPMDVSAIPV